MRLQNLYAAEQALAELDAAIGALGPSPWAPPVTCWWNGFDGRGACFGKPVDKRCIHYPQRQEFCPYCSSGKVMVYPCQTPKAHSK